MNKTTILPISGMHCASCDILVKKTLSQQKNIISVIPDFVSQTAKIEYSGELDTDSINDALCEYGYKIAESEKNTKSSYFSKLVQFLSMAIILSGIYFVTNDIGLWPKAITSTHLTPLSAFVLGLVASISTCMATSGALLYGLVGPLREKRPQALPTVTVMFVIGRVVAYGFFGFVFGSLGKLFVSLNLLNWLQFIISIALLFVGLNLLSLLPRRLTDLMGFSRRWVEKIEIITLHRPRRAPLVLGAATFFIACGFTWAALLYAISTNDPFRSATIMTAFALGTAPMLLVIGIAPKSKRFNTGDAFNLLIGTIIVLVTISQILTLLRLYFPFIPDGINQNFALKTSIPKKQINFDGKEQVLKMIVDENGYSPQKLTVKVGNPVKWEITGKNVYGCQGTIQAPKAGIKLTALKPGINIFEFTPSQKGKIPFACSMGMFRGEIEVI